MATVAALTNRVLVNPAQRTVAAASAPKPLRFVAALLKALSAFAA
jgi:hypothetical protein